MVKEGTIVSLVLDDDKEIVGEWGNIVSIHSDESDFVNTVKFLRVGAACVVLTTMVQTNHGLVPQKVLLKSNEGENFSEIIYVNMDKIIYFRELTERSNSYMMYKQTITDLTLPNSIDLSMVKDYKGRN